MSESPLPQPISAPPKIKPTFPRRLTLALIAFGLVLLTLFAVLTIFTFAQWNDQLNQQHLTNLAQLATAQIVDASFRSQDILFALGEDASLQPLWQALSRALADTDANSQAVLAESTTIRLVLPEDITLIGLVNGQGQAIALTRDFKNLKRFNFSSSPDRSPIIQNLSPFADQPFVVASQNLALPGTTSAFRLFTATPLSYLISDMPLKGWPPASEMWLYAEGQLWKWNSNTTSFHGESLRTLPLMLYKALQAPPDNETQTFRNEQAFWVMQKVPGGEGYVLFQVPRRGLAPANLATIHWQVPLGVALLFSVLAALWLGRRLTTPIIWITELAEQSLSGRPLPKKIERNDEFGRIVYALSMASHAQSGQESEGEASSRLLPYYTRFLSETARLAATVTSQDDLLESIVRKIVEGLDIDFVAVYLIDEQKPVAILKASYGATVPLIKNQTAIPLDSETILAWVAVNYQPYYAPHLALEGKYREGAHLWEKAQSALLIPLIAGNQLYGVLDLQSLEEQAFSAVLTSVLRALADQLATGLRNLRLIESTQVNLDETRLLYQSSHAIVHSKSSQELLEHFKKVLEQSPYVALLLEIAQDILRPILSVGVRGTPGDIHISTPNLKSALAGQAFILSRFDENPGDEIIPLVQLFESQGCDALALLPIRAQGDVVWILALGRRQGMLSEAQVQSYTLLTSAIGSTLERFDITRSLEQHVAIRQTLNEIVEQALKNSQQPQDLLEGLARTIIHRIGENLSVAIARYRPQEQRIEIPFLIENEHLIEVDPIPLGEGLTSYVIQTQRSLLINKNIEEVASRLGIRLIGTPAKSWLGVPLKVNDEVIGALILQDMTQEGCFDEEKVLFIEAISPAIALTLYLSELVRDLRQAEAHSANQYVILSTLLDKLPEKIVFKDAAGRFIYANPAFLKDYNLDSLEALRGKTEVDIFGDEGLLDLSQDLEVIHSSEARIGTPNYYFSASGENVWELTSRLPIPEIEGSSVRLIRISQDISELVRTQQLAQRRAEQLLTASEIAREAAGSLDINTMLQNATNQIRERLGYYHASVFLLDPLGKFAVLREASGEVGQIMKQAGHQLAVGSKSLVGQAIALERTVVVNNVHGNPDYYPNPLLPDTHSEIVVPLRVGERIIGALDVQSRSYDAFQPEDVQTLEMLADQLAIALNNTLLYNRAQQNLSRHRLFYNIISEASAALGSDEALERIIAGIHQAIPQERAAIFFSNRAHELELKAFVGFEAQAITQTLWQFGEGIVGEAAELRQPVRIHNLLEDTRYRPLATGGHSALAVPLVYQNEVMGVLYLESERPAAFDENDQEMFVTLVANLAAILTNARLVRQIQIQAERQRRLYEVTSKIRALTDIGNIIRTSATEIGNTFNARRVSIRIFLPTSSTSAGHESAPHRAPSSSTSGNNGHNEGRTQP